MRDEKAKSDIQKNGLACFGWRFSRHALAVLLTCGTAYLSYAVTSENISESEARSGRVTRSGTLSSSDSVQMGGNNAYGRFFNFRAPESGTASLSNLSNNGSQGVKYWLSVNGSQSTSQPASLSVTRGSDYVVNVVGRASGASYGFTLNVPVSSSNSSNSSNSSISLATALDNTSLSFTTGGSASWFGQTGQKHDGVDAARSGAIDHGQTTWMETTVSGPGTISFWWYVSCEGSNTATNWDYLAVLVDGVEKSRICGTGNSWTRKSYSLSSGSHTIRWKYRKDGSVSSGTDAGFVDQVTWTPTTRYTVTFNANGGSGSMAAQQFTQNVAQRLTANAFWRTGYTFAGWATSPGGSVVYSNGQSVRLTASRTLYAVWREIIAGTVDSYFAKMQKVDGALYKGDALVGTVQMKFGKVSSKNSVKVSATATMVVDGKIKKVMAKAVDVSVGSMYAILVFRDPVGSMVLEMKGDGTYTLRNDLYFLSLIHI